MKLNQTIAAAAFAGLFASSAASAHATTAGHNSDQPGFGKASAGPMSANGKDKNSCKGKDGCPAKKEEKK